MKSFEHYYTTEDAGVHKTWRVSYQDLAVNTIDGELSNITLYLIIIYYIIYIYNSQR